MTERIHRKQASEPAVPAAPVNVGQQSLLLGIQRSAGNAATNAVLQRQAAPGKADGPHPLPGPFLKFLEQFGGKPLSGVQVFYNDPDPRAMNQGAFVDGPTTIRAAPGATKAVATAAFKLAQDGGAQPVPPPLVPEGEHLVQAGAPDAPSSATVPAGPAGPPGPARAS